MSRNACFVFCNRESKEGLDEHEVLKELGTGEQLFSDREGLHQGCKLPLQSQCFLLPLQVPERYISFNISGAGAWHKRKQEGAIMPAYTTFSRLKPIRVKQI